MRWLLTPYTPTVSTLRSWTKMRTRFLLSHVYWVGGWFLASAYVHVHLLVGESEILLQMMHLHRCTLFPLFSRLLIRPSSRKRTWLVLLLIPWLIWFWIPRLLNPTRVPYRRCPHNRYAPFAFSELESILLCDQWVKKNLEKRQSFYKGRWEMIHVSNSFRRVILQFVQKRPSHI